MKKAIFTISLFMVLAFVLCPVMAQSRPNRGDYGINPGRSAA